MIFLSLATNARSNRPPGLFDFYLPNTFFSLGATTDQARFYQAGGCSMLPAASSFLELFFFRVRFH
jgi:hypothetical protein